MEIKNKVVIITGASHGIGLATAKYLTSQGAKIVLAARSVDKLKTLEKELLDSFALPTDMRKPEDIKNLVAQTINKYGRIDISINNAGQGIYGLIEGVDLEQYKKVMDLNVYAVLLSMQEVIPQMRKQGGGMIINVSSVVSKKHIPNLGAYAATKYALNAISLTARQELEKDHIVVSVMYPKMTATDFGLNAFNARRDERVSLKPTPGIIDTPEQVANKIGELIKSEEPEAMM